mgnify:CR=1 FL=1
MRAALPPEVQANTADPIRWDDLGNDCAGLRRDDRGAGLQSPLARRRVGGAGNRAREPAHRRAGRTTCSATGPSCTPEIWGPAGTSSRARSAGRIPRQPLCRYASPKLDLTAIGYQQSQNQQAIGATLGYYRSRDIGALHELQIKLNANTFWTTDGHWTARGNYAAFEVSAILPGYQQIGWDLNLEIPATTCGRSTATACPSSASETWARPSSGAPTPTARWC